jgi:hypothetical protein
MSIFVVLDFSVDDGAQLRDVEMSDALRRLGSSASDEEAEREGGSESAQCQRPTRQDATTLSIVANAAQCVGTTEQPNGRQEECGDETELAQVEAALPVNR